MLQLHLSRGDVEACGFVPILPSTHALAPPPVAYQSPAIESRVAAIRVRR
jgi:hypothetical protein